MISKDRLEEMEICYWMETEEEESKEWRNRLTKEERDMVEQWDKSYNEAI